MELVDHATDTPLVNAGVGLTLAEAAELRDSLDLLLGSPVGRHEHVSSVDGRSELTIWLVSDGHEG